MKTLAFVLDCLAAGCLFTAFWPAAPAFIAVSRMVWTEDDDCLEALEVED